MFHAVRLNTGLLRLAVIVGVVWLAIASGGRIATGQPPANPVSQSHGSPEVLKESLVLAADTERILNRLEETLSQPPGQVREQTNTVVALMTALFEQTSDGVVLNEVTGEVVTPHERTVQLLRDSPPSIRAAWNSVADAPASDAFRAAFAGRNPTNLHQIMRRYPLTDSALQAGGHLVLMAAREGAVRRANSLLRQLETIYTTTPPTASFQRQLQGIRSALQLLQQEAGGDSFLEDSRVSVHVRPEDVSVSRGWPIASWEWHESAQSVAAIPDESRLHLLQELFPGAEMNGVTFHNWKPVMWNGHVVIRTPFRIAAFEPHTGHLAWEILTDTFRSDSDLSRQLPGNPSDLVRPALTDQVFGLTTVDSDYLYFVDHLDLTGSLSDVRGFLMPGRGKPPLNQNALRHRLVTLRMRPDAVIPEIAWIAEGTDSTFDYRIRSGAGFRENAEGPPLPGGLSESSHPQTLAQTQADELLQDDVLPVGHQILTAPVGFEDRVFILTEADFVYFVTAVDRSTGRPVWRAPVGVNMTSHRLTSTTGTSHTSSLFIANESVVCGLHPGTLVALSPGDGRTVWATAVRDPVDRQPFRRFNSFEIAPTVFGDPDCKFFPVTDGNVIIWASEWSRAVNCVSVSTGELQWKVSRFAYGPGGLGGDPDVYCAGICGDRVVLAGREHVRALNLTSGIQEWMLPVSRATGRAVCDATTCLIPEADGNVVHIDITSGTVNRSERSLMPGNIQTMTGALAVSDSHLFVSTPVSLAAFPRSDWLLRELDQSTQTSGEVAVQRARLLVLNNRTQNAVDELLPLASSATGSAAAIQASEFAAELILQDWGRQLLRPGTQGLNAESRGLPAEYAEKLALLDLTDSQEIRATLFRLLEVDERERPAVLENLETPLLRQFVELSGWDHPVSIDGNWRCRPDILARHFLPTLRRRVESDGDPVDVDAVSNNTRKIAHAVLFPDTLGQTEQQMAVVSRLAQTRPIAAELLAESIQKQESAQGEHRDVRSLPGNVLANSGAVSRRKTEHLSLPRLDNVVITEEQTLPLDNSTFDRTFASLRLGAAPVWSDHIIRVSETPRSAGVPIEHFIDSFNMATGTLTSRIPLIRFSRFSGDEIQAGNAPDGAHVFSMALDSTLYMFGMTTDGELELLWSRDSTPRVSGGTAEISVGPVGSTYVVWQEGTVLRCSHPLTGEELWSRESWIDPRRRQSDNQGSGLAGKLFGDHEAVVQLGADGTRYTVYRTHSGELLRRDQIEIGRIHDTLAVGRKLLFNDRNRRLRMLDPLTGQDMLEFEHPVEMSGNPFSDLKNGIVVAMSRTHEIVFIDTIHDRIMSRIPVAGQLNTQFVFGMTAFERNGKTFVAVQDEQFARSTLPLVSRPDVRVSSGRLFCVDANAGTVQWSMRTDPAIIPPVFGDAANALFLWSLDYTDPDLEQNGILRRTSPYETPLSLRIKVIDLTTGALLAEQGQMSFSLPLR
ncbi:MAG: PQQ-like beta-propeller repeat protein, partial [Planctomycetaceae bacterium]|nr:PQQ-like beta-propeller repeat protein [Planctomycetaceae bacterium]